ncbi:MAG TPA: NIPSNAP family protein [Candidatus Binataceae bacterium]|nr:NIPSNAP family protein [Candidatus Binataceae bacterium]
MIVEMRTYLLKPRSVATVEERFGAALAARTKYSKLGAFFHTEVGTLNSIIHIWPYESFAHREQVRAEAAKEKGWPPNIREFIVEMKVDFLTPAPFSPALEPRTLGGLYEIRSYTYQNGAIPTVISRWAEKIEGRTKLSPLAGAWYSETGVLSRWVHIWAYKDFADRERVRAEAVKQGVWPPGTAEFLIKQENMLATPAAFSPLH